MIKTISISKLFAFSFENIEKILQKFIQRKIKNDDKRSYFNKFRKTK